LVFEAAKSDFEDFFDESSSPHAPDDAFNPRLLVVVVVMFVQNFVVPASNTSTCVPPWYIENIVVVFVHNKNQFGKC
jgi:hypothetical protein